MPNTLEEDFPGRLSYVYFLPSLMPGRDLDATWNRERRVLDSDVDMGIDIVLLWRTCKKIPGHPSITPDFAERTLQ